MAGRWRSQRVGDVPFAFSPAKGTVRSSLFAYDGDNLVEEANSSGTEVASYSQGLNIDEPLAMERSSVASFYEADGLGSVTSLSSVAGALAQTCTRDSFGKQTAATGSLTNPFQYTARESDVETGLYYYRARYYDPKSGRFLSEDPTQFLAGGNFYRYADNNPVFWSDASGLLPSAPVAILLPSSRLPGRLKLEGNLNPLCQKGRNLKADAAMLEESLATRFAEIESYESDPDPNKRALAGDPGHWERIEREEEALLRCKDNCPENKPEPEHVPFLVPKQWMERNRTAIGVGYVIVVGAVAIILAPETGGGSLVILAIP